MTYPIPNYSRIWVRGRIIDLGKAARQEEFYGIGQPVSFVPSPKVLLDAGTKQIITTSTFKVDTSKTDGYFAIQLPATNDPDIVPFDFTYTVIEPSGRASYSIKVPVDTPFLDEPGSPLHGERVLDLISVVPAPSPSSGTVQLLSGRGVWSLSIDANNHLLGMYTDGVTFDAGVVSVGSVNGKTGTVIVNKSDVGLGSADNTPDTSKPVSTAQQTAITDMGNGAYQSALNALNSHANATDPHTGYFNQTRGDARYRKITDPVTVPGVNGLSGSRFCGIKTTTGVPSSGTWLQYDMVYNSVTNKWMICTVAGTPGTWVSQA